MNLIWKDDFLNFPCLERLMKHRRKLLLKRLFVKLVMSAQGGFQIVGFESGVLKVVSGSGCCVWKGGLKSVGFESNRLTKDVSGNGGC